MNIPVHSTKSLIHLGSLDSFDITEGGKAAARAILEYLDGGNPERLKFAEAVYEEIIPHENFGGEYTALQWLCRLWLAPEKDRAAFLSHGEVASWHRLLTKDDCARLKRYLNLKYHFEDIAPGDGESRRMLRFLEDFILFSNPDRERWEKAAENLARLDVRPGQTVVDVGAGSGYYSFKFCDAVGDGGHVYAVETNPLHLEYLQTFAAEYGRTNLRVVEGGLSGIGLDAGVRADLIYMCSLYHVLYAALTEGERAAFMAAVTACLAPGGRFVVVDNDLVEEQGELPYHGPYIAKALVVVQLWHFGFALADSYQFTPQRYALVFRKARVGDVPPEFDGAGETENPAEAPHTVITVTSQASLAHYRMADAAPTAGYTPAGQAAAAHFLGALQSGEESGFTASLAEYEALAPLERIGDEYTAFAWLCRLALAPPARREAMLRDGLARAFYEEMGGEGLAVLRSYLYTKYELAAAGEAALGLAPEVPLSNLTQLSEYITFNNPARDEWEHTEDMLRHLALKPGECVADTGCGSGYFTYRFARAVGPGGMVYATEINRDALCYVEAFPRQFGLENVRPVVSALNDAKLPENSVDTIFMCSMYHAVYIASIEFVKDEFIASLKKALRPGGRLVVVDNDVERPGIPPYFGSQIDRQMTISQLTRYGFVLADQRQFVPQRYMLTFRMK